MAVSTSRRGASYKSPQSPLYIMFQVRGIDASDLEFAAFELGAKDAREDSKLAIENISNGKITTEKACQLDPSHCSRLNRSKLLPWQDKHYDEGYAWMWDRELPLIDRERRSE